MNSDYVGVGPEECHPTDMERAEESWAKIEPQLDGMSEPELEYIQAQIRRLLRECYSYGETEAEGA